MALRNEKGITLVALIITIIVMLILVGVTVNLVINGGIFEKARDSTSKTKEQIISEEIIASLMIENDGHINVYATYTEAKELFESENKDIEVIDPDDSTQIVEGMDEITIKVSNEYTYVITKDGITNLNE